MIEFKDIVTPVDCTITKDTTLGEAISVIKRKKWSLLPVTDGEGRLAGVFTRSRLFQMVLDQNPLETAIRMYIKAETETIRIDTPYEEIARIVQTSRVGTGVVLDESDRVIGLLTKTDMVMALLAEASSLKDQLEAILKESNIGVLMADEHGTVTFVNDRLCRMAGMKREGLMNRQCGSLFPGLSKQEADVAQIDFGITKAIVRTGTFKTTQDRDARIVIFHDNSQVEKMAEELESVNTLKKSIETALEHAYDGLLMTNRDGTILMVSPPLLELFGLSRTDVLGENADRVFPQLKLSSVFKTETAEISDFKEVNGIKYIVQRIPVLKDGEIIGAIGKVMFRQLNEVNELFKKWKQAERKASFYHQELQKTESARFTWGDIFTRDTAMEKLKKSAAKAAKGRSTILVRGESGTGKELFAQAIHNSSARSSGKFVVVNCAAIPEDLLESEFFGYEEGAFTGAKQRGKIGKFDLANGGTLFLDEIGDMSLPLQAKLLRVLQEREFYRVGGMKKVQVDVRIIAATNRDLEAMVKAGLFREDLYYRLNVISLNIPPLRERIQDTDYLIGKLMEELNRVLGTSITSVDPFARKMLLSYSWPGNVRELRNVMERAMTFAEHGNIQTEDLPDYLLDETLADRPGEIENVSMAEEAELAAIRKALSQAEGNKVKAAKLLGISRSGLYEKIKKYKLPV
ncbi:sigma-54-dependent Fis family transcriptional regulator [Mesobacillus zeae]|uniref:PAS domain S-box protein n=1 Tax=Mesobacillus zeae TaxID=1917180 RepID=A0A398B9R7_9BACI|nr:sigma-54-dependent Fis family transcriptional regulator [Mesobacillus zeae]RID84413.1 PAS domain S-box protein [Mesobacillus zeae]